MKISPALELQDLRGTLLGSLWTRLCALWASVRVQRRVRRLRLCESLSLGEKRVVAVVEFEDQRFLLAATPEHITLLQTLDAARPAATSAVERP
jgi:flagellar biogenesis protein FliO